MAGIISERRYREFRDEQKTIWQARNAPCALCGQDDIDWDGPPNAPKTFELDHKISRKRCLAMGRPDLLISASNSQPTHSRCNRNKSYGDARPGIGQTSEEW